MRLLHENEFSCIGFLLEKEGQTITLCYSDIDYFETREGIVVWDIQKALNFISELHKNDLIIIKSSKIDWSNFFYDSFLRQYSSLIKSNDIESAKNLAVSFNLKELNETLIEQKSLKETYDIINNLLNIKNSDIEDGNFPEDLYRAISLTIEIKKELKKYLEKYIEAFKKDELEKPLSPKENWAKVSYFDNEYYRYKKQREIFIELLQKKLDIQNPQSIKIGYRSELPLEHLNLQELLFCLGKEGIIKESEYAMGDSKNPEDFGGDMELRLSVDEDKILNQIKPKEIKLNLSFAFQTGIITMIDQNRVEYKIKLQGQVQREVLRVIFRNSKDTYSEWNLSDISEILGGNDVNETAVKNAIYQFNKKVKLKIPEITNLFELTKYSARINPKYISKN